MNAEEFIKRHKAYLVRLQDQSIQTRNQLLSKVTVHKEKQLIFAD